MAKGTIGVRLSRDWFGPDGSLYLVKDNPHVFPAEYADKPKQADDESDEDFKLRQKRQPFAVLPSTAEVINEDPQTVVTLQNTANGEQLLVPTVLDEGTKSVGGALDNKGVEQPDQSVAAAAKGADALNVDAGRNPRSSGPLPAAATQKK